jgi:hypothetical protein
VLEADGAALRGGVRGHGEEEGLWGVCWVSEWARCVCVCVVDEMSDEGGEDVVMFQKR